MSAICHKWSYVTITTNTFGMNGHLHTYTHTHTHTHTRIHALMYAHACLADGVLLTTITSFFVIIVVVLLFFPSSFCRFLFSFFFFNFWSSSLFLPPPLCKRPQHHNSSACSRMYLYLFLYSSITYINTSSQHINIRSHFFNSVIVLYKSLLRTRVAQFIEETRYINRRCAAQQYYFNRENTYRVTTFITHLFARRRYIRISSRITKKKITFIEYHFPDESTKTLTK